MRTLPQRLTRPLLLLACLGCRRSESQSPAPVATFDYRDLGRFSDGLRAIDAGAPTDSVFAAYLKGGGAGLRDWTSRYKVTPQRFSAMWGRFPNYMRHLPSLEPALRAREPQIAAGLRRFHTLASAALGRTLPLPPVHYFVSPMGGGGSAGSSALMLAIDFYGLEPDAPRTDFKDSLWPKGRVRLLGLDDLVVTTVHELAHSYQRVAMGVLDYTRMYRWGKHDTLAARAVREGCAEFLAELVLGTSTSDQRIYGLAHEKALWDEFRVRADLKTGDNPGWFSGRNTHFPDAPNSIGYFVGMRMCRAYYESVPDRALAMRNILNAHSDEIQQEMLQAYARTMGTTQ